MEKLQLKTFIDVNGRLVTGKLIEQNENHLRIECPVAIIVKQSQNNGIAFSLIPIVFKEILADDSENPVLTYNLSQITLTDVDVFETRIMEAYSMYLSNKLGELSDKEDVSSNISEFPTKKVELFDKQ